MHARISREHLAPGPAGRGGRWSAQTSPRS
jgi:hypothetical protein